MSRYVRLHRVIQADKKNFYANIVKHEEKQ